MKNKILPIVAVIVVIVAICVIVFIPKNNKNNVVQENTQKTAEKTNSSVSKKMEAILNESGNIVIDASNLDTSNVTFITYKTESGKEVELVAIKDKNDNIDVAFNTCQVCNGSPKAYFTQERNKLVCQNCGNIFDFESIGAEDAGGCNPITILDADLTKTDTGIEISKALLEDNVSLFENVENH